MSYRTKQKSKNKNKDIVNPQKACAQRHEEILDVKKSKWLNLLLSADRLLIIIIFLSELLNQIPIK